MKKHVVMVSMLASILVLGSGCATSQPIGTLYTNLKLPVDVTANQAGKKMGVAESKSILSLIATGDSSIGAAMRNGNITKVSHVDWEVENILGIIGTYRTIVYGE
jgi:hypothetical protein